MFDLERSDTIVAPATPPGEGGVAIVRLSGPLAAELLLRHFRPARKSAVGSHQFRYGRLVDEQGQAVDEVMAVLMLAPHSFTREDVAEIHCHGGRLLVRRILDLFQRSGARPAQPGEFTLRAFLNGRIDLTQAEAVIELIEARSDRSRQLALEQLDGRLGVGIHRLRDQLADLLALVEAWIDFPEEELEIPLQPGMLLQLAPVMARLGSLLDSYHSGRAWLEGISVLFLGKPNVGKSSLLNSLLETERAIVTDVPGTTRDLLEEGYSLDGLPLRLIDAAGLRETLDPVEIIGVTRTRGRIPTADLVLAVFDGSKPLTFEDYSVLDACRQQSTIVVLNKSDLGLAPLDPALEGLPYVALSVRTGEGLSSLKQAILDRYPLSAGGEADESVLLTEQRHWDAARRASEFLHRLRSGLEQGLGFELLALELRGALDALGEITGETTPDAILDRVFSRFCIGK